MTDDLKPCPFCGSAPIIYSSAAVLHGHNQEAFSVSCYDRACGVSPRATSFYRSMAIDAWNRRASGWISMKERMPPSGTKVIVCVSWYTGVRLSGTDTWDGHSKSWLKHFGDREDMRDYDGRYVTHWMPLPEVPNP